MRWVIGRQSVRWGRLVSYSSVDRSTLDDPLGWLTDDGRYVVEVSVVVQDRERGGLGDCGDEEIGDLASLESIGSELTLDLLCAIEMVRFDIDAPECSEGNGEAVPLLGVARRGANLEVGRGRACEAGSVEFLDPPEDGCGTQSGQNARVEQEHQRQAAERSSRSASASTDSALAS